MSMVYSYLLHDHSMIPVATSMGSYVNIECEYPVYHTFRVPYSYTSYSGSRSHAHFDFKVLGGPYTYIVRTCTGRSLHVQLQY